MIFFPRPKTAKETFMRLNSSISLINELDNGTMKKQAGIYIIYKDNICLYVGQSKNLASRITTHLFGKYESADEVFFMLMSSYPSSFTLEEIENATIKRLNPIENVLVFHDTDNEKVFTYFDNYMSERSINIIKQDNIANQEKVPEYRRFYKSLFVASLRFIDSGKSHKHNFKRISDVSKELFSREYQLSDTSSIPREWKF